MLNRELDMDLQAALESEAQAQAICMQHPDFRAAYDAWFEKRPIVFAGANGPFIQAPAAGGSGIMGLATAISGGEASTVALKESTEAAQFVAAE